MDRMSVLDAGFWFAESGSTPMHVGSVSIFDGPAPSYGDLAPQPFTQALTTNVPGPRVPLHVLGREMTALYAYVPIALGMRVSVGVYPYRDAMTFGINADFDAFPDAEVLAEGVRAGLDELVARAGAAATSA